MKNLACFGHYDGDNNQCIKCNDTDCKYVLELKMECDERCRKDVTKCDLWDTEHCILHQ